MDDLTLRTIIEALLGRLGSAVTADMKLDFLERLSWLLADEGELFALRRAWISSTDDGFIELALMPWNVAIARDRQEAEALLAPLAERREYQGRVEERLAEFDQFH